MHCLTNSLFFDIPLLYFYTSLNSSIICCLFAGDMYLSFGASDSSLASLFCGFLETLVILSAILLPIKSPVTSAIFRLLFLKQFLLHLVLIILLCQEIFDHIYCLIFYPCFLQKSKICILLHIFNP